MRHRHVVAVDRIGCARPRRPGRKVGNDLVAVKVEIDPFLSASSFRTAQ